MDMRSGKISLIATTSALAGLLFGYDTGVIASALLFVTTTFHLTPQQIGYIVSAVPAGALLASLASGKCADYFGRKKSLLFTGLIFIIGSTLCALAPQAQWLLLGRFLIGIAVGLGSCISPIYTAELATEHQRGWLVNTFVLMIQAGICLSFLLGYIFSFHGAFRILFALGIFPAFLLVLFSFYLPESPRWLLHQGKKEAAHHVFLSLLSAQRAAQALSALEALLQHEKVHANTHKNLAHSLWQPPNRRILCIGIAVSIFTQTIGINMLNYYAPILFRTTGFVSAQTAMCMTFFMGLTLTLSTAASLFIIDRIGRRQLLLVAMQGILASLLLLTLSFFFIKNPQTLGWCVFICTLLFMLFHGIGIGPACFLIPAEIFPLRIRGRGMGISVACNWGANVIVTFIVPTGLALLGAGKLFLGFFLVSTLGYIIFYFIVPETRGMTLEEIETNTILQGEFS